MRKTTIKWVIRNSAIASAWACPKCNEAINMGIISFNGNFGGAMYGGFCGCSEWRTYFKGKNTNKPRFIQEGVLMEKDAQDRYNKEKTLRTSAYEKPKR